MATVLEMIQDAAARCGVPQPTSAVGSSDQTAIALLSVAQQEGTDLSRRHQWQALTKERAFATLAQEVQTGILPADFDRFIPGTFYNRSKSRIVTGPLTAQEYADYKGRLTSIVYDAFRVRGNAILILPTPAGGENMAFEYVSKWWAGAASDTEPTAERIAADSDQVFIDEECFRLGIVWRYLRGRGLDYSEAFEQYELAVATVQGRDGGTRTLNMGARADKRVPRAPQAPDGNWSIS